MTTLCWELELADMSLLALSCAEDWFFPWGIFGLGWLYENASRGPDSTPSWLYRASVACPNHKEPLATLRGVLWLVISF